MRYFLKGHCGCNTPTEHEVSKADYIVAEIAAGVRSNHAPEGEADRHKFEGMVSGRVMVDTPQEALRLLVGCLTSGHGTKEKDWKSALIVLTGGLISEDQIEAEETRYWNT